MKKRAAVRTGMPPRASGITQTYVQDGSYLKLREVNLSYNLPNSFTQSIFGSSVRYARLSLGGAQPAALYRLPWTGPRGQQLRQPGHRTQHRRGPVPAEPQLLLLDRLGVLTMTPITRRWYPVLLLGVLATGACSFDESTQSKQSRSYRREPVPRARSPPLRPACSSRSGPTSPTSRWTWGSSGAR